MGGLDHPVAAGGLHSEPSQPRRHAAGRQEEGEAAAERIQVIREAIRQIFPPFAQIGEAHRRAVAQHRNLGDAGGGHRPAIDFQGAADGRLGDLAGQRRHFDQDPHAAGRGTRHWRRQGRDVGTGFGQRHVQRDGLAVPGAQAQRDHLPRTKRRRGGEAAFKAGARGGRVVGEAAADIGAGAAMDGTGDGFAGAQHRHVLHSARRQRPAGDGDAAIRRHHGLIALEARAGIAGFMRGVRRTLRRAHRCGRPGWHPSRRPGRHRDGHDHLALFAGAVGQLHAHGPGAVQPPGHAGAEHEAAAAGAGIIRIAGRQRRAFQPVLRLTEFGVAQEHGDGG